MIRPKKIQIGNDNIVLLIGLLIIASIWASTIFLIPTVSSFITNRSNECIALANSKTVTEIEKNSAACQGVLSKYGATGDLFGAVTSLFSALGFFAVAATLHIEAKARRGQLKPFVVAQLRSPGCTVENPDLVKYNSISITIPLIVKNLGEPAIRVRVQVRMRVGNVFQDISETALDMPLVKDLEAEQINIIANVQDEVYQTFVEALSIQDAVAPKESSKAPAIFVLKILYTNLAGVDWITTTEYSMSTLNHGDRNRFIHLFNTTDKVEEEWRNRSVLLSASVVKDSWSYNENLV
jgi:hypothetical protein